MADIVLPKEINYREQLPALPECSSTEIVLSPSSGNGIYGPNNNTLLTFDLPQRGVLIPESLYVRYKYTVTASSNVVGGYVLGTPLYSCFQKEETLFGSTIYESINNYNQVCDMYLNATQDFAGRYGRSLEFGWNNANYHGHSLGNITANASTTFTVSGPLPSLISNAEQAIPLEIMPLTRLQLTMAPVSQVLGATSGTFSYSISNVELCFQVVDFTSEVKEIMRNMGDKLFIKSHSFINLSQTLSQGATGLNELIFNTRLASIKSLFSLFTPSTAYAVNGIYDSLDITNSNGQLQYTLAGQNVTQRQIDTSVNRASVFSELRKAVSGGMSVNDFHGIIGYGDIEDDNDVVSGSPTTFEHPSLFYFGINTERMATSALLTGQSTQNTPITLRLNLGTPTTYAYNVSLIALHDALIEIHPDMREAMVQK